MSPVDHTALGDYARHGNRTAPTGALLSATSAAMLLGVSRRHFYNLKERFDLWPCSAGTKARPLYRRDDILRLANRVEAMPEHEWVRHHAHLPEVPDR
ncbi:hypothetical protein ABUE31_15880 [Mesorhizobium sp. ZMM04-5]|uniref:Helix-turn-helix domain-containing protein n=2 Tax=Mesorhizobium marinum TaxID=3228790 RepID=A0ABV3R4J9_9HYPH